MKLQLYKSIYIYSYIYISDIWDDPQLINVSFKWLEPSRTFLISQVSQGGREGRTGRTGRTDDGTWSATKLIKTGVQFGITRCNGHITNTIHHYSDYSGCSKKFSLAFKHQCRVVVIPYIYNVASWLVCGPPPPLNYFWTLFKVESQTFSSQKKNISSIK